jgi:hypothetical protein
MYRQSVNTQELNKRSTDVFDEYMEDAAEDGLVPLLKVPIPYTSDRMFGEGEGFLHDDVKAMEPMVHRNASNGLMVLVEEWENLFELSMEDEIQWFQQIESRSYANCCFQSRVLL